MQNPYHGSITEDVPVPESELVALAKGKRRTINVALVGNPNCGRLRYSILHPAPTNM